MSPYPHRERTRGRLYHWAQAWRGHRRPLARPGERGSDNNVIRSSASPPPPPRPPLTPPSPPSSSSSSLRPPPPPPPAAVAHIATASREPLFVRVRSALSPCRRRRRRRLGSPSVRVVLFQTESARAELCACAAGKAVFEPVYCSECVRASVTTSTTITRRVPPPP